CGTFFICHDAHLGSNPLSGDLYESKFTWWKNGVLGAIACHAFFQKTVQFFAISRFVHIDKINNHNAPHITRSEEHTSELQSRENLVCRRLLEKKKPSERSPWRRTSA